MSYSERILEARKRLGVTQADLAESAGVVRATINRIENGTASPTVDQLMKIAKALSVSVEWLFTDEDSNSIDGRYKGIGSSNLPLSSTNPVVTGFFYALSRGPWASTVFVLHPFAVRYRAIQGETGTKTATRAHPIPAPPSSLRSCHK